MAKYTVFRRDTDSPMGEVDAPSSTQACQKMAGRLRGLYPGKPIAVIAAKLYAYKSDRDNYRGRPRIFG